MTTPTSSRVEDLRRTFDQAFAATPPGTPLETLDLLAIRIGGDPYALKVSELTGLVWSKKIVSLPSSRAELVGIAGIRGSLVSVYSLAVLLGYGSGPSSSVRWLALSGGPDPIALAFEELEGFLRVNVTDLYRSEHVADTTPHVAEFARVGQITRLIVETRSALSALRRTSNQPAQQRSEV
jgi:chemotaxis signal transduction protein